MQYKTLVQISDCHIDKMALGVNTQNKLKKVITSVNKTNVDLVIITGDLVNNASDENYKICKSLLNTIRAKKISIIAGNHDNNELITKHLNNYCNDYISLGNWDIIFINSIVKNQVYGFITTLELKKLEKLVRTSQKTNIILAIHHPIVSMASDWNDKLSLTNSDDLFAIISKYPKIKSIAWGHSHEYKVFKKNNLALFSCPSSAKQFNKLQLKSGYLQFKLLFNGTIIHKVVWI